MERVREFLIRLEPRADAGDDPEPADLSDRIDAASDDEIFDLIDNELGIT
ncbi:MAG: hypothetical protein HOV68_02410 [Streptomycetaceae bacterium]|nr:hypothetical protein [Streptomycetaceae bacterium]